MDFGKALEALKKNKKVARNGWNGKGMFIFRDPGYDCNGYQTFTGEKYIHVEPHLLIKNVRGTLDTWVPSISDLFAEDWQIVD